VYFEELAGLDIKFEERVRTKKFKVKPQMTQVYFVELSNHDIIIC